MRLWLLASLLVVCGALLALDARGASTEPLFVIARSKNANIVRYDVRPTKSGYDIKRPLDVYWLMQAEDGRREELSEIERRTAYGYELLPGATATTFVVRLVAVKARPLTVRRRGERFGAELLLAGAPARLERVFVATKESGVVPRVLYIELSGRRISDGKPVRERIQAD